MSLDSRETEEADRLYKRIPQGGISGAQGIVTEEYDQSSGKHLACKTIRGPPRAKTLEHAKRECRILKNLQHPNVVSYRDSTMHLLSPIMLEIKLFMDFCQYGSLRDLMDWQLSCERQYVDEEWVWSIISQVASALEYCHFGCTRYTPQVSQWKPIIHRDIKPGNILLASTSRTASDAIKLADFGLSIELFETNSYAGTRVYLAPEINREKTEVISWTPESDIYSFGLTMYELCKLELPYSHRRDSPDQFIPPLSERYSGKMNTMLSRCLSYDPQNRPTAIDIRIDNSSDCVSRIKGNRIDMSSDPKEFCDNRIGEGRERGISRYTNEVPAGTPNPLLEWVEEAESYWWQTGIIGQIECQGVEFNKNDSISTSIDNFVLGSEDLPYEPLHLEYLTRLGDLDLALEDLADIKQEYGDLAAEQEFRARIGLEFGMKTVLEDLQLMQASVESDITIIRNDVEVLHHHCLLVGIKLGFEEDNSSTSDSNRQLSETPYGTNHGTNSLPNVQNLPIQELMFTLLLPFPDAEKDCALQHLITEFDENNKSDRINRWLLYSLRMSKLDVFRYL